MRFELNRLVNCNDESLLSEFRRVSKLVAGKILTQAIFVKHSKVHSSTICKRFGGWKPALDLAGVSGQYSGESVSEKMRNQRAKKLSPMFQAVVEATGEAIYNSLLKAADAIGYRGHSVKAIPINRIEEMLKKYGRLR